MSNVIKLGTECCVCGKEFECTDPLEAISVGFVARGFADVCPCEDDSGRPAVVMDVDHDIKFERAICQDCWLTDPDLCRFFNKLGLTVR